MPPGKSSSIPLWQQSTSPLGANDRELVVPTSSTEATSNLEVPGDFNMETKESILSAGTSPSSEIDATGIPPTGLNEHAATFVQDASIKEASPKRKAAFLESKGVKREEIELLLGNDHARESVDVLATEKSPAETLAHSRGVPPVITYPEFLVHASKPAPLVTSNLLLNTAYVATGMYATIYGLSKYILGPMEASLTQSRHNLLKHTTTRLDELNTKLYSMVSSIPAHKNPAASTGDSSRDHPDDESDLTSDSDPTELYHRDFGTQTSPTLSRRASSVDATLVASAEDVLTGHESRLKIMTSHLKELESSRASIIQQGTEVNKQLSALTSYLHEMTYTSPYYRYGAPSYSPPWPNGGASSAAAKESEIEKLKTEIRGVKGVLLSTRSFPRTAGKA